MRVDPYPISGPGTIEVKDGAVHIEGGRGIPWQVEVGGMLGLIAGVAISVLVLRPFGATLTLVGIMVGIVLGSAAGYRWAGNKIRARHQATFAPNALVDVSATDNEVLVTISFRKRLQTRKQCIHFRPTDVSQIEPLRAAVTGVLVQKVA
jgi:hypothetical protein